jgi:hypothetical protein
LARGIHTLDERSKALAERKKNGTAMTVEEFEDALYFRPTQYSCDEDHDNDMAREGEVAQVNIALESSMANDAFLHGTS